MVEQRVQADTGKGSECGVVSRYTRGVAPCEWNRPATSAKTGMVWVTVSHSEEYGSRAVGGSE